jgi:DNA-binding winged helix-turn-helix (wHTH) protein
MDRDCYIFGPFHLFPSECVLLRKCDEEEIDLGKRSFDLLVVLVTNAPDLISRTKLMEAVWQEHVEQGNLSTQISNLRKSLGDDESAPKYIQTIRGRGFRFKAPVTRVSVPGPAPATRESGYYTAAVSFEAESHRFVPVYVGKQFDAGVERSTKWGKYREASFDGARLCVSDYGVGVWHIRDVIQFANLVELAKWRREGFQSIFRGEHPISAHTARVLHSLTPTVGETLYGVAGKLVYVLSAFVLKSHTFSAAHLKPALRLISCPKALLQHSDSGPDSTADAVREQQYLESGFEHSDLREFGVLGSDLGYAGWSGVSYHGFGKKSYDLAASIVEFELALQALWLFCCLIKKKRDCVDPSETTELKSAATTIRRQLSRLKAIGPKDPTEERIMCEAIFMSSRIEAEARATLEMISRYQR